MKKLYALGLCLFVGCEQRADVGDLPGTQGDAGPRDASNTIPGTGLLEDGDFPGALAGYDNGSTPGDGFGACFARTMLLFERPEVDAALAKLGQPAFSATQILGPDSIPARIARSWSGSAELTLGAPINKTVHFDRAKASAVPGVLAQSYRENARASISLDYTTQPIPTAGYRADYTYDCTTGRLSSTIPFGGLSYSDEDRFCTQTQQVPIAGCTTDGGSLEVLESGTPTSGNWKVRISNLVMECSCRGVACGASVQARMSGQLGGPVASKIDRNGLHPWLVHLLDNESAPQGFLGSVTAGTTLEAVLRALYPLTNELSQAATDCEHAGQASGVVFVIPGQLWAGEPLPVTGADALILAGLLRAFATMLHFASGYEHSFILGGVCTPSACIDNAALVTQTNAAMPANRFPQSFISAKAELDHGLTSMIAGIDALGPDSVFARNAETQAGLAIWRSWMTAGKGSLASGRIGLDGFTPIVAIDLQALFATPPTPATASVDPLVMELTSMKFVEAFYDEVFKRYVDVTADGSTDYRGPEGAQTALEAASDRLNRTGLTLDE